ncbi:MAG: hypothetical protein AABZ60_05285 [Planctomycetota bacterium]
MVKKCCLKLADQMLYTIYEDEMDSDDEEEEEHSKSHSESTIEQVCSCGCLVKILVDLESVIAEVWEKGRENNTDFEIMERSSCFFSVERGFKES